jgi:hypothetical protein
MAGFLTNIRRRLRDTARAAGFAVVGIVFALTGLAFLTAALWIFIAQHESVLVAHIVIGAIYLVLGLCFVALGGQRSDAVPAKDAASTAQTHQDPQTDPILKAVEAFAVGLQAGRDARNPRR